MGSLISPIPRAELLFPVPQPQECGQTGFVLSPPMPPCSCSLWVLPRVALTGPEQFQELPAHSLQLHQAGLSGGQESFELI